MRPAVLVRPASCSSLCTVHGIKVFCKLYRKYKERNGGGKPEISFVALRNSKFEGLAIYRYSKYLNDEAIVDIFSV